MVSVAYLALDLKGTFPPLVFSGGWSLGQCPLPRCGSSPHPDNDSGHLSQNVEFVDVKDFLLTAKLAGGLWM